MAHPPVFWIGFHVLIALLLILDLKVFHRKEHRVGFKEASYFTAFSVGVALLFNLWIYFQLGSTSALQFFTGYIVEKSLSVDNLLLFLILFSYFSISPMYQHKILFWGIIGALIFRILFILIGVELIQKFHFMFYLFGAFLLVSGLKFFFQKQEVKDPSQSTLYKVLTRVFPVAKGDHRGAFFIQTKGGWKVSSLFLALVMIECTDVILALDSIPAVFAITTDPFLVYTSNVFAILGLRALFFVVAASLQKWRYLKFGLAAILVFIGTKMLLAQVFIISLPVSLVVIVAILALTALISLKRKI